MRLGLFYDTETTGLPDFKAPSDSEHQPHIVQIAAALVDLETKKVFQSIDFIVKPDGWEIPQEASDVHGITDELAEMVGLNEEACLSSFLSMNMPGLNSSGSIPVLRIGHNISFDDRIIRIAMKRFGMSDAFCDKYKKAETSCTMQTAKNILKLPPTEKMKAAGFNTYKNPNLGECYKFFFDKELDGAHNAMVDVQATIDVYFAIQDYLKNALAIA